MLEHEQIALLIIHKDVHIVGMTVYKTALYLEAILERIASDHISASSKKAYRISTNSFQCRAPVIRITVVGVNTLHHTIGKLGFAIFVNQPLVIEGACPVSEVRLMAQKLAPCICKLPNVSAANLRIASEELQRLAE
ncbi:hypothetical protein D3C74_402610 [compost metagenome]